MASVLGAGTYTREREQRVFAYAMLASIVLHGALLFAGIVNRDPTRKPNPVPGPLVARLAAPQPVAAPTPAPEPPKPRAEEPPQPVRKLPPVPVEKAAPKAPVVAAKPAPTAPASDAPKPVAESAPPAAPSAPASAPPSPGPVAKADPQPAPSAPAEVADKGNLDQYRLAIYDAAKRYKRYPRIALDNNWEGRAVIHLVIGANGMIASISIKTSTGHDVLDQAALETLRKAKPLVPIPAALRGREFGIDINFIFNVKDENA